MGRVLVRARKAAELESPSSVATSVTVAPLDALGRPRRPAARARGPALPAYNPLLARPFDPATDTERITLARPDESVDAVGAAGASAG